MSRRKAWNSTLPAPTKALERIAELQRHAYLRAVNPERRKRLNAIAFGAKADWVRSLPCLVCGAVPSDPAHVKSRGAGGTAADILPLCRRHHMEQHALGVETFGQLHALDMRAEADGLETKWQTREAE